MTDASKSKSPEWATVGGDAWAERWPDIDRALSGLSVVLDQAIAAAAPRSPFRAFDVGCGAGSTSLALVQARPEASIIACDLSPALGRIAEERSAGLSVRALVGDAEVVAGREGPFDLIFSRHGVMFFPDPTEAFRNLRAAASPGAALVFSCFQAWDRNPWASELASAAAGRALPAPGQEPGGFAFAEPDHVRALLKDAGWTDIEKRSAPFRYVAGRGEEAVDEALSFLAQIGPASRIVQEQPEEERPRSLRRMRDVLQRHFDGTAVIFPAAAWIWSARAGVSAEA